jgi:hypothetical protein
MIEFLTLIVLMCEQPGVGHGIGGGAYTASRDIREEAFAAKTACIKRLYGACKEGRHYYEKSKCVVEKL